MDRRYCDRPYVVHDKDDLPYVRGFVSDEKQALVLATTRDLDVIDKMSRELGGSQS